MPTFGGSPSFGFGKKAPAIQGPPEKVGIMVLRNQIVIVLLPHGTNRANEIRVWFRAKVRTSEGHEIFIFNGDTNNWTNVPRSATNSAPAVTAPPIEATEKAFNLLKLCPAVSSVTIMDEAEQPITLDDVKAMRFIPLEESAVEETDEVAEAVIGIKEKTEQHDEELLSLKRKLARAEEEIEKLKSMFTDFKSVMAAAPPPKPSADEVVEVKKEEQEPAAAAPKDKGRLARAAASVAAKKQKK